MTIGKKELEAAVSALSKASGYASAGSDIVTLANLAGRTACLCGNLEGDLKAVAKSMGFTAVVKAAIEEAGGEAIDGW